MKYKFRTIGISCFMGQAHLVLTRYQHFDVMRSWWVAAEALTLSTDVFLRSDVDREQRQGLCRNLYNCELYFYYMIRCTDRSRPSYKNKTICIVRVYQGTKSLILANDYNASARFLLRSQIWNQFFVTFYLTRNLIRYFQ